MAHGELNDPTLPIGEPFEGETLMADGWVYRDLPSRLSHEMWGLFIETLGEGNYRVLAMTITSDWVRGQLFISPEGMKNLTAWKDKQG